MERLSSMNQRTSLVIGEDEKPFLALDEEPPKYSINLNAAINLTFISVACAFFAAVMSLVMWVVYGPAQTLAGCTSTTVNATCIQHQWQFIYDTRLPHLLEYSLNAAYYLSIIPGIRCLGSVYGDRHAMSQIMSSAMQFGAGLGVVETLYEMGLQSVSAWIMQVNKEFDDRDWRSVSISYQVVQSSLQYLFSLDVVLLGLGMWAASYVGSKTVIMSRHFIRVGYIGCALALVQFLADLVKLEFNDVGSTISFLASICLRLGVLPLWSGLLGQFLARVRNDDFGAFMTLESGLLHGDSAAR